MGRFKYYYCWEKRGSRAWLVRATNAEHARQILSSYLNENVIVETVRCAADRCTVYNACGQQVVELPPQGGLQPQQSGGGGQPGSKQQPKGGLWLCRSPLGWYMFCWEHEVEYYRRRGWRPEPLG